MFSGNLSIEKSTVDSSRLHQYSREVYFVDNNKVQIANKKVFENCARIIKEPIMKSRLQIFSCLKVQPLTMTSYLTILIASQGQK